MKPSYAEKDRLIDQTLEVWQPRVGRDLSREDARQIVENVTGFFCLLIEWSRAEMLVPANVAGESSRRIQADGETCRKRLDPSSDIREGQA